MRDILENINSVLTVTCFKKLAEQSAINNQHWFCEYFKLLATTPFGSYLFFKENLVRYYEECGMHSSYEYDDRLGVSLYNRYNTVSEIEECVSILKNHIKYKNINNYINKNSVDNDFSDYSFTVKFEPNYFDDGVHAFSFSLNKYGVCECKGANCFYRCRCDACVTQMYYGSLDRLKKQSIEDYAGLNDVNALRIIRRMIENNNLENILKNVSSKITKKHKSKHVYKFTINTSGCPDKAEKWSKILKLENQFMYEEHEYARY